ncbi:MAG: ribonuclease HII [Candidatus Omnitrophota bacterium]
MCNYDIEHELINRNYRYICGVDEVGRGAAFGPVAAGAVILNPERLNPELNDSKKLSPKKRLELAKFIYRNAVAYSIGWSWNDEIDEINILQATKKAMKMAVKGLQIIPDYVLMDGMKPDFIDIKGEGIIGGDSISFSIAAASIIAKVFRDELMTAFSPRFPQYFLENHKGYLTAQHLNAISTNGLTEFHRKSFEIGKTTWQKTEL